MKKTKDRVLDRIDYKILRRLQENGRMTNADLARSVNLSPTPCLERVRRLEADGYQAVLRHDDRAAHVVGADHPAGLQGPVGRC